MSAAAGLKHFDPEPNLEPGLMSRVTKPGKHRPVAHAYPNLGFLSSQIKYFRLLIKYL